MCDFSIEALYGDHVCGIDEVGRGPLAGPVVSACVYIPVQKRTLKFIDDLQDSKKLSRAKLEYCEAHIFEHCIWSVAESSVMDIDKINILKASLRAMEKAYKTMPQIYQNNMIALIDGPHIPNNMPNRAYAIKKGDSLSKSIAAASIIAKLARDRIMENLHNDHPEYGWNSNVGYPTKKHKEAISQFGITKHHRKTFAPVRAYLSTATS